MAKQRVVFNPRLCIDSFTFALSVRFSRLDYALVIVVGQLSDHRRLLIQVDVLPRQFIDRFCISSLTQDICEEGHESVRFLYDHLRRIAR